MVSAQEEFLAKKVISELPQEDHYCQQLPPSYAIVPLLTVQFLGAIGQKLLLHVLNLLEHTTNPSSGSVGVGDEFAGLSWEWECWGCAKGRDQAFKRPLAPLIPAEAYIFPGELRQGNCLGNEMRNEPPVVVGQTQNCCTSRWFSGGLQFLTQSINRGFGWIPLSDTTCPKKTTSGCKIWHLLGFSLSPADSSRSRATSKCSRFSCMVFPKMIKSSKYMRMVCHCSPRKTSSMQRWNVLGAEQSPKGILVYSYRPYFVMKAVLGMSAMAICQYLDWRSRVVKNRAPRGYLNTCLF